MTRVIPCLLLSHGKLVKTVQFQNPNYIGDPVNAVKIYNEKEVDELIILDIAATKEGINPSFEMVKKIADECFMPLCYGGGIRTLEDIEFLLKIGVEKVAINTYAYKNPLFVEKASKMFGAQSIIVSIDVNKFVYIKGGTESTFLDPIDYAKRVENAGAGEILLTSISKDGTMSGYDLDLISRVSKAVKIPVIACGGAGKIQDFLEAVKRGASACAAGSLFVYHGRNKAVLINFPSREELKEIYAHFEVSQHENS